jgi:SAM-dependent methyltransferase
MAAPCLPGCSYKVRSHRPVTATGGVRYGLAMRDPSLISDLSLRVFLSPKTSLFRHYQDRFLERFGADFRGELVELGGERSRSHRRYFPNVDRYRCTNIARDCDEYLDVTDMHLADDSVDGFLCVSVLEHVFDIHAAIREIERTLRPGGKLLMTVPFGFPRHDEVDYWRLSSDAFPRLLQNFEIAALVNLGGLISTIVDNLKRPKDRLSRRYLAYKALGLTVALGLRRFDQRDGFPLGYGVLAVKRAAPTT